MMRDPVCGMTVGDGALTVEGYPEYGFCSGHCHEVFLAEPSRFEGESAGGETISRQEPAEGYDEPASPLVIGVLGILWSLVIGHWAFSPGFRSNRGVHPHVDQRFRN
ncbi:MAG: YHS domain-containing protein [Acidobacteria bacterium]|nr:YHS domain-containing protein [Acidobacteriota bacterium]